MARSKGVSASRARSSAERFVPAHRVLVGEVYEGQFDLGGVGNALMLPVGVDHRSQRLVSLTTPSIAVFKAVRSSGPRRWISPARL